MDFKQIQELIRLINKSNIGEITVEEKGFKITIKQKQEAVQQVLSAAPVYAQQPLLQQAPPAANAAPEKAKPAADAPPASNLITIKSPMIGTFYRRASPDKPLFVEVGDEITPGKVVCIIEAMKLFNEIEAEISGTVVKVTLENASPVEYDQVLYVVEPD